jgi:hypothetical protein
VSPHSLVVNPMRRSGTLVPPNDPTLTDVPQPEPNHERNDWKPIQGTPFVEGSRAGDDGIRHVLEMVCAALAPR